MILKNLTKLRELVEATHEKQFNLATFRTDHPCGTVFCAAGIAASDPYFQAQGLTLQPTGYITQPYELCLHDVGITASVPDNRTVVKGLSKMFGRDAWNRLFVEWPGGIFDDEFDDNLTDKELALTRIDRQIKELS
jgi:hypothetical protein